MQIKETQRTRGKPSIIVLEEAMEDLAQQEPTIMVIKEEDNKPLEEETTIEVSKHM